MEDWKKGPKASRRVEELERDLLFNAGWGTGGRSGGSGGGDYGPRQELGLVFLPQGALEG